MSLERIVKELQDNMLVIAEIEKRQSALRKDHSEWLAEQQMAIARHERMHRKIDENLSEITDKLNGLIGYIDGQQRPPQ